VFILETNRLILRQMEQNDYSDLAEILQDEEVMYAYEGAFSDIEVQEWLNKQITRYQTDGFGLWAVISKETGDFIGQAGLSMQECDGEQVCEVGYLFKKKFWHKGYATEAAIACKEYAFYRLEEGKIYSIIRDNNIPSQNVAKRNGMKPIKGFTRHYKGVDMPHYAYVVEKP
jgi:ribosomal-protein-alanine N-acetyltransferase